MNKQSVVVDVHYHFIPAAPDDIVDLLTGEIKCGLERRRELPDKQSLRQMTRENLIDPKGELVLSRANKVGVDVTCINLTDFPHPDIDDELMLRSNQIAADLASQNPGKIFSFAGVDPRRPSAAEIAKTCLEDYGMIGIKWHPDLGFDPTSPEAYEVLKVLDKNDGILLTHTTHTGYLPGGRCKYTNLSLISEILMAFPGLKVIAAHMGKTAWHEWAGLAHEFPNLYGDLAEWGQYGDLNYEFFCRQLRELTFYAGVDKVLWGTDDPFESYIVPTEKFIGMMRDLPRKALKGYEFSQEEVDLMMGENAARLLGINR